MNVNFSKDYYKILGVSENATEDEIRKAYRRLAKEYHPDSRPGDKAAEERFKEIAEAYEVLSDPQKRAQYDQMRKFGSFAGGPGFEFGDFDLGDLGGIKFEWGSPGGGFSFRGFGDLSGDIQDILERFFGRGSGPWSGRRSGRSQAGSSFRRTYSRVEPERGSDIQAELEVPFEVAVNGGKQTFTLNLNGVRRTLAVTIPPGIDDGEKIRLRGQGAPGPAGAPPGDLILTIRVAKHPFFEKKGADVYCEVPINVVQAILGTKIKVRTIAGQKVLLTIPPGTQSGQLFRLKGLGAPAKSGRGDQYVRIRVEIPKHITERQRQLLEEFAKEGNLDS